MAQRMRWGLLRRSRSSQAVAAAAMARSGVGLGCGTVQKVSYILDEEPIGARLRVALLRTHIGNSLSAICSFSCGTARNTAVAPVPVVRPPDMRISIFFFPHEIRPLTTPKRQKPVR